AVAGGGDGGVERVGRAAGGVGDDDHPAVGGGDLVGDLLCAVLRRSDGEDDFDLAGVLLGEDLVDGFAEMALLVQDRHDDGDGGPATRLRWRVRRVGELLHGGAHATVRPREDGNRKPNPQHGGGPACATR